MNVVREAIPMGEALAPRNEKVTPADYPELPYMGLDDIEAHSMRLLGSKPAASMKSSAKRFYPGDVLYSRLRPYLNKVWPSDRNGICSSEFIVMPGNQLVDPSFLALRLNAMDFVSFANSLNAGDRPRVDFGQISTFCLPPFSLDLQRRIVAKIDELFSELDRGIESLKTARAKLDVYRQAVLKHAFEGKLTAQWREEDKDKLETSEQLLARVKQERAARYEQQLKEWKVAAKSWGKTGKPGNKPTKPKKLQSISHLSSDTLDSLPKIPNGWTWLKLEDVCNRITDGEHFRPPVTNEGIYFLSAKDVREDGVSFDDALYINNETAEKALAKCNPEYGDLLMVSRGATVGRTCVVRTYEQFCLLGSVILIKPGEVLSNIFISFFLRSSRVNQILVNLSGSTAQQAIYLRDIKGVDIPVCSLPEQQEIVRLLEERFTAIEQQERVIDSALKQAETFRQSILKKAFAGQLVGQDPHNEPASVLLDRIRAERERTEKNNRSRKTKKRKTST